MNAPSQTEPDIKVCGLEPIRFVGAVQPHGAILVIDPVTQSIVAASESCSEMLGASASTLLGSSAHAILGQETADALLSVQSTPGRPSPPLALSTHTHVACARTNETGLVLVDIEEVGTDATLVEREFRYALSQLRQLGDLAVIAGAACQTVRRTTGFDRVMVWRFDADWHADVIAEAREAGNVGIYRSSGEVREGLVQEILTQIPEEKIIWEAPQKAQQVYFMELCGANVNLGNIAPNEVIPLEATRLGLRGDTFNFFLHTD